jgi:hypothetical protein
MERKYMEAFKGVIPTEPDYMFRDAVTEAEVS